MLNYVWIGLIVIGIFAAVGNDLKDDLRNTYRNGESLKATVLVEKTPSALQESWEGEMVIPANDFNEFYGVTSAAKEIRLPVKITTATTGESSLLLNVNTAAPEPWRTMAKNATSKDNLTGTLRSIRFEEEGKRALVEIVFEPIRFVKIRAVTQATLDYASTAVNIALGLIGIMALWLGVMKVAEEAGMIRIVTRLLTPVTKRLFPEVPPDHPAVGSIVMNLAANMLGLSNAATPMGLKAMEELNKLNPKLGTATNAMCTFLVINTSGLVLIPATAIAVRAAAGSANPGMIIGTSIFGASCATIAGLIAVKLLQRMPRFKKDDPDLQRTAEGAMRKEEANG
jgi:spore maturation protein A